MFDLFRLKEALVRYKQDFVSMEWKNEKYKWEAVKWFQDHWDVNATDFPAMLNTALDKTFNLLASANNFPKGMIVGFAKSAPEEVRAMFIDLFDENKDVYERIDAFKLGSSKLLERYGNGAAQHISLKTPSAPTFGFDILIGITSTSSVRSRLWPPSWKPIIVLRRVRMPTMYAILSNFMMRSAPCYRQIRN